MLHASREGVRAVDVQGATTVQAEEHVRNVLQSFGYTDSEFQITTSDVGGNYSIDISIPMTSSQVTIADPFSLLGGGNLSASATMRSEEAL